jgi:hypothetical protein
MFRACFALAAIIGLLAPAAAAPPASKADPNPKSLRVPPEELSKAHELVRKLGSEGYAEREEAERALAEMGRLARPALLDAAGGDPDPEVRARCSTLLPKATAAEMKARLASFMADAEGKYEHDLPGWHKLRATVRGEWQMFGWTYTARPGADKAARELFIEFMQARGGRKLLAALDGPPDELGRAVAAAKQDHYSGRFPRRPGVAARTPSPSEVAVTMLAESQVPSRFVPRSSLLTAVISTSGLASAVRGTDDRSQALQAVVNAWFDSRSEPAELYSALSLANNTLRDANAACRLAGRLMGAAGAPGFYKGQALTTLVRHKAADQLPALEKAFDDKAVLTTTVKVVNGMQVRQTIEVRDAALAAALMLTGQDPVAYGFDAFPKNVANGTFSYMWAKIPAEKRDAAFARWKEWREKNP